MLTLDYEIIKSTTEFGLIEPVDHPWRECNIVDILPFFDLKSINFDYYCISDGMLLKLILFKWNSSFQTTLLTPKNTIMYIGQCPTCFDIYFFDHPEKDNSNLAFE